VMVYARTEPHNVNFLQMSLKGCALGFVLDVNFTFLYIFAARST
jgi:hypothetical protein